MCKDKRGGDRRTPQQYQAAQERAAQMAARRAGGMTLAAIAREFGVTRQRVHAILTAQDPGELAAWQAEQARQADWERQEYERDMAVRY